MRIAIVGTGYVGLVSAACFAEIGHAVTAVDRDARRIGRISEGEMPIYEPGLAALVAANTSAGRLVFTQDLDAAVAGADVVLIAVGTPSRRGDGHADLSYVEAAAGEIARAATGPLVVVTKSTVPVGTGDTVARILSETRPNLGFSVVSNPEFLREGAAIEDFMRPDRIVIGAETDDAHKVMTELYAPLGGVRLVQTDRRSAELIKYGANAFLAMKISFVNEMADLAERTGADIADIALGLGLDSRIGPKFLSPGPGFSGSCFPKDTLALARMGQEHGAPQRLVEATVAINDARKQSMAERIVAACGGVSGKTIGVLGLTFKPGTDDMREAPALDILDALKKAGGQLRATDPQGMAAAAPLLPHVEMMGDAYSVAQGADALVLITEWPEFAGLDWARVAGAMRGRTVIDLRNALDPSVVASHGLIWHGIGRPSQTPPDALSEAAE